MFKNLNAKSLGLHGRQSELIELTLTYKFDGFDIDMEQLLKQAHSTSASHVARFIESANVKVGSFELPIDFMATEEDYQEQLKQLDTIVSIAEAMGAKTAIVDISPYSTGRPYHEDFELHRSRIAEVASRLDQVGVSLALGFVAPAHHREGKPAQFVATPDALLTLIKTVDIDNVGLSLDLWHWTVAGGKKDLLAEFPANKVLSVRLADLPEAADRERVTEADRLVPGKNPDETAQELLAWLVQEGYEGPVTPFCHPDQFSSSTRNRSVEEVAEHLDQLLKKLVESDDEATAEPAEAASGS